MNFVGLLFGLKREFEGEINLRGWREDYNMFRLRKR